MSRSEKSGLLARQLFLLDAVAAAVVEEAKSGTSTYYFFSLLLHLLPLLFLSTAVT